jgi:hypothetical protein
VKKRFQIVPFKFNLRHYGEALAKRILAAENALAEKRAVLDQMAVSDAAGDLELKKAVVGGCTQVELNRPISA